MVKEFYGHVEVHSLLVWPENYKFDFFELRDNLFAISQLHTMASSLLIVTSSERKFLWFVSLATRKKFN